MSTVTVCRIRAPHGGRLGPWPRQSQTPNKGFALAWGPRPPRTGGLRASAAATTTPATTITDDNYNRDGEV